MKTARQKNYGIELAVNASGCDISVMTREKLAEFIKELCEKIDKQYFKAQQVDSQLIKRTHVARVRERT